MFPPIRPGGKPLGLVVTEGTVAISGALERECGRLARDPEGFVMAYIVQTKGLDDHSATSVVINDRKEALATAVKWASEGHTVGIIGNGRIYGPEDLAAAIINNE